MKVNNIQNFRFPVSPQEIRIIRAVTSPVLLSNIVTKTLSIKIFKNFCKKWLNVLLREMQEIISYKRK